MHSAGKQESRRGVGRRRVLVSGVVAGLAVLLIGLGQGYVFQIYPVLSRSMAPTLLPQDLVFVNRLAYSLRRPRRGDLLVFHYPQANDRDFLKRVIGVPGDIIEEWGGTVWVSGAPLTSVETQAEPVSEATAPDMPPIRVPAGQYFVLGDNATASLDSRVWGPVSIRDVVGRALFICWSHGAHWWDIRWDRIGRRVQ